MSKKDDVFEQIIERAKKDGSYYATYSTKKHMSKKDEAMKLALDYLLSKQIGAHIIVTLREALAEQPAQQEPAGSVYRYGKDSSGKQWHGIRWTASGLDLPDGTLIYTSPPAQRTWVGLTHDEIKAAYLAVSEIEWAICGMDDAVPFTRIIEAKLREKNT